MKTHLALVKSCPGCDEEGVQQKRDTDGFVLWVAVGWPDNYPGNGIVDVAIDFCPFCAKDLREDAS